MTPPGEAAEIVTVVEHPAFASLYRQQLIQEGLPLEIVDVDKVPRTTVTVFPDESKDLKALDLAIPKLSQAHRVIPTLDKISFDEVKQAFSSGLRRTLICFAVRYGSRLRWCRMFSLGVKTDSSGVDLRLNLVSG